MSTLINKFKKFFKAFDVKKQTTPYYQGISPKVGDIYSIKDDERRHRMCWYKPFIVGRYYKIAEIPDNFNQTGDLYFWDEEGTKTILNVSDVVGLLNDFMTPDEILLENLLK